MWGYNTNPKPGTVFRPLSHVPKKIPVQYWEEIKPGTLISHMAKSGSKLPDMASGGLFEGTDGKLKTLKNSGGQLYLVYFS